MDDASLNAELGPELHWQGAAVPGRTVLDAAGIPSEPDANDPQGTVVYEFPIQANHGWPVRTVDQVSMWEQAMLVMAAQRHWADNSVSVTVKFDPQRDGGDI